MKQIKRNNTSPYGVKKVELKPIDAMETCSMAFLSRSAGSKMDLGRLAV